MEKYKKRFTRHYVQRSNLDVPVLAHNELVDKHLR